MTIAFLFFTGALTLSACLASDRNRHTRARRLRAIARARMESAK